MTHPLVPFVCRLSNRRILRVRGTDAHEFLQGIFTNDLRQLHPSGSMYGCFLYFTGRVLCDAHIYQCKRVHEGQASILVDVHEASAETLYDHLVEMKMRKKVKIDNVGEELAVVATLAQLETLDATSKSNSSSSSGAVTGGEPVTPEATPTLQDQRTECFADPRTHAFFPPPPKSKVHQSWEAEEGDAAIDGAAADVIAQPPPVAAPPRPAWFLKRCVMPLSWAPPVSVMDPYFHLLYGRGIGEGPAIFKHNKTLPFEGNLDFLDGVSFHKGCYVGQELTHRTHVMLVTRKRTVPLAFGTPEQPAQRPVEVGESLFTSAREKIGEVTGVCGDVGIGLLRLRYVDKESKTVVGLQLKDGVPVHMELPDWWPRKEVRKLLKNNG